MKPFLAMTLFLMSLSVSAFADEVTYSYSGTLGSGVSVSTPTADEAFSVTDALISPVGSVSIVTSKLTSLGSGSFSFSSGTFDVLNASSQLLFKGTFGSGTVNEIGGLTILSANPGPGINSLNVFIVGSLVIGSADTVVAPEPSTLGLMGTGLIGLAGLLRRKLL